jgi:hypothetical protein
VLSNIPPIQSTLKNKKLHSQTGKIIYSVEFMENESNKRISIVSVQQAHKRKYKEFEFLYVLLRKLNEGKEH